MKINEKVADALYHSNLAIPPGEYLEEVIEDLGMTKDELAKRMDRPASKLSHIFKGEKAITPETAIRLEKVVGVPAHIWTGLEAEYRLALARQEDAEQEMRLRAETKYVRKFCYAELAKLGEVDEHTKPIEKVRELHRFFGTLSLATIPTLTRYRPAYRLGAAGGRSPEALAAWIRLGERRAAGIDCEPFCRARLRQALPDLRALTWQDPQRFMPALEERLASCGVALAACPHFPKTKAHGAAFHLRADKVVLMITMRGRWADIFWFRLFHEIGHILHHSLKEMIVEDEETSQREAEADQFAAETLIPQSAYESMVDAGRFNERTVSAFAKKIGVHPGIVVGRLQHEKRIEPNRLNGLRMRFDGRGLSFCSKR